ncbi:hypothetical protein H6F89_29150 [Cyanobacteria bacterium FACHB-63]|nr:hypothetical protein [Cyanobacteria bacterium FACHB-63]
MIGDIKLDSNNVVIEGDRMDVMAADIQLDCAGRRKTSRGMRRALVHGFNDELLVNFNGDYPGGVTVASNLRVNGKLSIGSEGGGTSALTVSDLEVRVSQIRGHTEGPFGKVPIIEVRTVTFQEVFDEVQALKAKVVELEAKLKPS